MIINKIGFLQKKKKNHRILTLWRMLKVIHGALDQEISSLFNELAIELNFGLSCL